VVDADGLAQVLSQFARTMGTDFLIQTILDELVQQIVEVLPITGAGVTVISTGLAPQYLAASDEVSLDCVRLRATAVEVRAGPVLDGVRDGSGGGGGRPERR